VLCISFLVYVCWCKNNTTGIGKLSTADGKAFADPEVLRRLTSSVSCALDEAAAALTRMRAESTANAGQSDK
jgi:ankyrin repeat domain-containing protein 17